MNAIPSIEEWIALTEEQRRQYLAKWNAYAGEGAEVLEQVVSRFRAQYGHLKLTEINGPGIYHGGEWVIGVTHPFVFDRRSLPSYFLALRVHTSTPPPLPREFEGQKFPEAYVWSPPNYERFVDRCAEEIRNELGNPTMSREDMLHALLGFPFETHLANCREWVKQGKIPAFE